MAIKKQKVKTTLDILDNKSKKHNQFEYSEIFRNIRTNIEFSTVGKEMKSVAITSTQPSEGKSTISINLAYIFATKYERVLLIDCDLRKSILHKYMRLSNQQGLTDALIDFNKNNIFKTDYIQKKSHPSFSGNLYVLTSGTHVPNPSELLDSDLFKEYISVLKKHFDFIVIDCAPVGTISDAVPVGHTVDGIIFVVSSKDTKRKDATNCVKLLQKNKVTVLGSILTKTDANNSSYSYYNY